jgi:hypothetical protein
MYYLVVRLKLLICAVSIKSHDYGEPTPVNIVLCTLLSLTVICVSRFKISGLPHVKHHLSLLNAVLNFTHHAHELFGEYLVLIRAHLLTNEIL